MTGTQLGSQRWDDVESVDTAESARATDQG